MKLSLLLLLTSFLSFSAADLQAQAQRASPKLTSKGEIKHGANLTITYSSPGVKGRKIWGGLVPFDKVWRTGANMATKLTASHDFTFGDKKIPAGSYSLWTLPGKTSWTVILSSKADVFGASGYDDKA